MWKVIISPEFGERVDLRKPTRELMVQVGRESRDRSRMGGGDPSQHRIPACSCRAAGIHGKGYRSEPTAPTSRMESEVRDKRAMCRHRFFARSPAALPEGQPFDTASASSCYKNCFGPSMGSLVQRHLAL